MPAARTWGYGRIQRLRVPWPRAAAASPTGSLPATIPQMQLRWAFTAAESVACRLRAGQEASAISPTPAPTHPGDSFTAIAQDLRLGSGFFPRKLAPTARQAILKIRARRVGRDLH